MSFDDVFSNKLRFSRRQVTKRSYVLPSLPNGDRSKTITPKNGERHYDSQYQSSPLVPPDDLDVDHPPSQLENEKKTRMSKSTLTNQKNKQDMSYLKKKQKQDSRSTQKTRSPAPVEISYLASTPKPGKQQLLRQRPFIASRERERENSVDTTSSSTQPRSSSKSSQLSSSSKTSNSVRGSRKRQVTNSIKSPRGDASQSKKRLKTITDSADSSRSSVEKLTKALVDKRILKHREKQNISVGKETPAHNSQIQTTKAYTNGRNSSLHKSPGKSLQSTTKQTQLSEESYYDAESDIENQTPKVAENKSENQKTRSTRLSLEKSNIPTKEQKENKENKTKNPRGKVLRSSAKKHVAKSVSNQKASKEKKQSKDIDVTVDKTQESEQGASSAEDQDSDSANEPVVRKDNRTSRSKVKGRPEPQNRSTRESQTKNSSKSQVVISTGSQVRSKNRKRRLSSDSESQVESQEETSQTQRKQLLTEKEATISIDDTVTSQNGLSRKQNVKPTGKKKSGSSTMDDAELGAGDQTMMVWGSDDMKRKKTDLVDVDVVLNSFSEVLESQMDVCESGTEQKAVRILEKYLRQDITSMIRNVQNMNSLQKQVRKTTKELKQKKIHLMSLQNQRLELEEKVAPKREQIERNGNLKEINSFMKDLQKLIALC